MVDARTLINALVLRIRSSSMERALSVEIILKSKLADGNLSII